MSRDAVIRMKTAIEPGSALGRLRALASDRIVVIGLLWAALAFGLRPLMLSALYGHTGAAEHWLQTHMEPFVLARQTAVIQWASFAGVLMLAVILHIRRAVAGEMSARDNFLIACCYALLMFGAYLAFLWSPTTVLSLMSNDSMIFFDAIYRIGLGQRPSVDFPTALGPVTLYLPALGAWLTHGNAGAVEAASAIFALVLGIATAQAGAARFPSAVVAVLVLIVFLIVVPAALLGGYGGNSITAVGSGGEVVTGGMTLAMLYNRWGWAMLIPIFCYLAPRRDNAAPTIVETVSLSLLLAILFYLKLNYFVVGLAACGLFAMLNPGRWRTLGIGAAATLALVLLAGLTTGLLPAYLRDVAFAAKVSGGRGSFIEIVRINLRDLLLAGAPLAVLAFARRLLWRDVAMIAFMIVGCLFVINQNSQYVIMPPLAVIGAYGVARMTGADKAERASFLGAFAVFLLLCSSLLLDRGLTMIDQAYAAHREHLRGPTPWTATPGLRGVYVMERESYLGELRSADTEDKRIRTFMRINQMGRLQPLRQQEYMETLVAGAADLRGVIKPGESIVTLDMSNPFPFMLNARPAKGSWLTMDAGRTLTEKMHPAPEDIFADADHVMIAKLSLTYTSSVLAMNVYAPWLAQHYAERVETPYWVRFSHRKPAAG
jgi:hypothetical protein